MTESDGTNTGSEHELNKLEGVNEFRAEFVAFVIDVSVGRVGTF